jgi:hypothetical protein
LIKVNGRAASGAAYRWASGGVGRLERVQTLKMAILKAEIDQFEWNGNILTHSPTGATFCWQYGKSRTGQVVTDWKQAADVLATGDEFDPDEIDVLARSIMNQYEGVETP